ncbi:alpha/beta fold hydrolase [Nonomuraea soli]|uniref:Pimeloyl-ACP methyl ester carboxylesterase n=1 Tax=Nonomuraea soli TaxID=1032476 RepID=A0A7W0HTV2_9ACTN|nr:alpha/beta hydrolase [Nonomuraea soli]MBA2895420.1 pimeloyl-ACP methyl ester carboxylesterase [Nonomuraea soli]
MTAELTRLAHAVLSVRPLVDVLEHPVRLAGPVEIASLVNRMAAGLGAPEFHLTDDHEGLGTFERVVSDHLGLRHRGLDPRFAPTEIDRAADEAAAGGFEALCARHEIPLPGGGPPLPVYSAGEQGAPAVVIVAACGMPAKLCEEWVRFLAADHHVVTWETRGLFGSGMDGADGTDGADPATDVDAQAGDLFAVMDHFDVRTAHLMCLCGGAVIGLAAAHRDPARVSSLSLWHGDFAAVAAAEKTHHQQNLVALMDMGAADRDRAAAIHPVLCQTMLSTVPPDLAHLVVYPYATADLLFRYCRLNGEIMKTDVTPWLAGLDRPVLVVTSEDDETAHPDGSRVVAEALPDAKLHVRPHGDHISLFQGDKDLMKTARDFIQNC